MHYTTLLSVIQQQIDDFDKRLVELNNEILLINEQKQKMLTALSELNSLVNNQ
jgi:hypothetical protein